MPEHLRASFGGMSAVLQQQAEQGGLPMVSPQIIPNSRRALEASEYAREEGAHGGFHKAVFHQFYGLGNDIHQWAVLSSAAREAGLDPVEMQAKTETGKYQQSVDRQKAEVLALGATGVPLFIFDNQYAVIGLQPYAAFQEVMGQFETKNHR